MWYTLWIVRFRESMGISTHNVLSEYIRTFVCLSGNNIRIPLRYCRHCVCQHVVLFTGLSTDKLNTRWHVMWLALCIAVHCTTAWLGHIAHVE